MSQKQLKEKEEEFINNEGEIIVKNNIIQVKNSRIS